MLALMLMLTQPVPEAGAVFDAARTLDAIARSSDLIIVGAGNDQIGPDTPVLEANIDTCIVTLKTNVEPAAFTAKVVALGEGSLIEPVSSNRIRVRSAPELKGELILHSDRSIDDVLRALASTRSSCQIKQGIF